MKTRLNLEPVKNWLGFTRRERRSTSILLSLIIVIIAFRYFLPEQNITVSQWDGIHSEVEVIGGNYGNFGSALNTGLLSDSISTQYDTKGTSGSTRVDEKSQKISRSNRRAVSWPAVQERPRVDLNRCDTAVLVALPGIGPVLSVRILKYRNLLGGFASVEQLKEVYGLSEETYELIKESCFADTAAVRRVRINTSVYKELCRIPYLEKFDVAAILKFRELNGRIGGVADLTENKILTKEKADKAEPYMDFR